jgi:hypothetical protein
MQEYDEIEDKMMAKLEAIAAAAQQAEDGSNNYFDDDEDEDEDEMSVDRPPGGDTQQANECLEIEFPSIPQPPAAPHRVIFASDVHTPYQRVPRGPIHHMVGCEDWIESLYTDKATAGLVDGETFDAGYTKWAATQAGTDPTKRLYEAVLWLIFEWYSDIGQWYYLGEFNRVEQFFTKMVADRSIEEIIYDWASERIFYGTHPYPEAWDSEDPRVSLMRAVAFLPLPLLVKMLFT